MTEKFSDFYSRFSEAKGGTPDYYRKIEQVLADEGEDGNYDPRHIEAFMRENLERPTLGGLSEREFNNLVWQSVEVIEDEGKEIAEKLAQSYGL